MFIITWTWSNDTCKEDSIPIIIQPRFLACLEVGHPVEAKHIRHVRRRATLDRAKVAHVIWKILAQACLVSSRTAFDACASIMHAWKIARAELVPRGLLLMPTRRMERVIFNKYLGNLMMMLLPEVRARDKLFLSASNVYSHIGGVILLFLLSGRLYYAVPFFPFLLSFFFFFGDILVLISIEFIGAIRGWGVIRFLQIMIIFVLYDSYYYVEKNYIKKMENGFYSNLKFVSNKIKFVRSDK